MAVKAFAVVVGSVETDGMRNGAQILQVDMRQAAQLCLEAASVESVVRVVNLKTNGSAEFGIRSWRVRNDR